MWHGVIVLELFSFSFSSSFSLSPLFLLSLFIFKSCWGQVWEGDKKEKKTFGMTCREANYKERKCSSSFFLWFLETNTGNEILFFLNNFLFDQRIICTNFASLLVSDTLSFFLSLCFFFVCFCFIHTVLWNTDFCVTSWQELLQVCINKNIMMLRWREKEERRRNRRRKLKERGSECRNQLEWEGKKKERSCKERERERKLELRKRVSLAIIQVSPSSFSLWCLPDPSLFLSPLFLPIFFLSLSLLNSSLLPFLLKLVSHSSDLLIFLPLFRIWTWLVSCYKGSCFD